MIEIENVSVVCDGQAILEDISFNLVGGECLAIIGPNGSGKSTLLALLSGYLWPSTGSVTVAGQVFGKTNLGKLRQSIGLIEPSRMPSFDERMVVREMVATGLFGSLMLPIDCEIGIRDWARVDNEINAVGLNKHAKDSFGLLSTGEKMKAYIARAMVSGPELLLLDEPTVGLDIGARAMFMESLENTMKRYPRPTIVIVSHHLDELPRDVDKVMLMKDGMVFEFGRPEEILTSQKLSVLFDCKVNVFEKDGRYAASA